MKNFTLTCLSVILAIGLNAQTQIDLPISWDDPGVDYTTTPFGDALSAADLDPLNAANNVLKFTKSAGAQPWAGVTLSTVTGLASLIPFDSNNNIISVKVYSPAAGLPMRLKAEVAGTPTESVETDATTTIANAWETLTFDFSNESAGTAVINYAYNYNMLSFFGDFQTAASGQEFFMDSVLFGLPVPPNPTIDTNSVTFQVDMRGYTGSYTTPEVNGLFNGWCGNCTPLSDPENDSIWVASVDITLDTIEYKFSHDAWTGQEDLDSASSCVKTTIDGTEVFVNRFLVIESDTILPVVCWNSCEACKDIGTGILSLPGNFDLNIYPNPTNGIVNIETASFESYVLTMMDALGRVVYASSDVNKTHETIDVSSFDNGIYMVFLKTDNRIHTSKVMVSK